MKVAKIHLKVNDNLSACGRELEEGLLTPYSNCVTCKPCLRYADKIARIKRQARRRRVMRAVM